MTLRLAARAVRAGEILSVSEAEGSREVEISFSSEAPVVRLDFETGEQFLEVLGHAEGEVDLARLNSGAAPLLKDHRATLDDSIGTVARAWLEDGKGRAVVRFSSTSTAEDVLARVRAGDVTCVSVGYRITQAKRDGKADGLPVVRATEWAPYEISFVAIPADPSVGYGRAEDVDAEALTIDDTSQEDNPMPNENPNAPDPEGQRNAPAPAPAQPSSPAPDGQAVERALATERGRIAEIDAIASTFDVPADKVTAAKRDGVTADAFRQTVLDFLGSRQAESTRAGATMIGLTEKEKDSFSVVRLLRALANPDERRFREAAGFELEAAQAAADAHKGQVRGVILPADVTHHAFTRASNQTAGSPSAGGNVVDETLMSGNMIDILRNMSILPRLGARTFAGLVGDVAFPKQLSDVTAAWVAEDGSASKSGITFGQVKMSPHTVAAMNEISRRLLIQDSVDVEAFVRQSIMAQIALAIDSAGLGDGTTANAPEGLAAATGVNVTEFATAGAPTYAETVNMRTKVKEANALQGSLAYTFPPAIEEHLLTTPKFEGGETPIMVDEGRLGGYRAEAANQVADGAMWFGNWSDLYMGLWSGLDLLVDPYTNSASGAVRIVAHQDVDFAVARGASFTKGEVASGT